MSRHIVRRLEHIEDLLSLGKRRVVLIEMDYSRNVFRCIRLSDGKTWEEKIPPPPGPAGDPADGPYQHHGGG